MKHMHVALSTAFTLQLYNKLTAQQNYCILQDCNLELFSNMFKKQYSILQLPNNDFNIFGHIINLTTLQNAVDVTELEEYKNSSLVHQIIMKVAFNVIVQYFTINNLDLTKNFSMYFQNTLIDYITQNINNMENNANLIQLLI